MAPVPALTGAFLPAAGVGVVNFDGSGSLTLTDTVSSGGKVAVITTTGMYTVNSHDGRQILAINTIQGRVASVNLERQ
jgi:hypothetical protein